MLRPSSSRLPPADLRRLVLFGLCGALAIVIGFVVVPVHRAGDLIEAGGYYYMAAVFAAFGFYGWRVAKARSEVWKGWLRRPGWTGVALAAAFLGLTFWFEIGRAHV